MEYIITVVLLFILMLAYFKIADKYNIIDKPNERSSHKEVTLRGGGVVFPMVFIIFLGSCLFYQKSLFIPQNFVIFGFGLFTICIISFIDDLKDLSNKIRLVFHFIAVTLLLYFVNAFSVLPIWWVPFLYIFVIGVLNAYNFMDGINGITGIYSLAILGSLLYVDKNVVEFTDKDFIIYPMLACLVFLFFNFRNKAKCFAGDVGSMGIAFWVVALLGLLVVKTGQFKWLLFLTVYGVEVALTIFERILLKENIFKAHRRHLYQLFVNERNVSHLVVSSVYAILQFSINALVIYYNYPDWIVFPAFLIPIFAIYLSIKISLKKQIL